MEATVKDYISILARLFDDDRVLIIESLPMGDKALVIWIKMLCEMGKTGDSLTAILPYTGEQLAAVLREPISAVRAVVSILEQYNMVEITAEGVKLCCAGELWV